MMFEMKTPMMIILWNFRWIELLKKLTILFFG